MKSQVYNRGALKELRVKIEKVVVEDLKQMAINTGIPLAEHVVIALKRYRASHADYLDKVPVQE